MQKKIAIIGAGIAGLTAGCYLQMNGYESNIFEFHDIPGGLCTAWERKGFIIDGCIHWLVGSTPANEFYYLWNEVCDMKNISFFEDEIYIRFEGADGKYIDFYRNVDKLESELLDKAPEDRELILEFTKAIRNIAAFKMPLFKPKELINPWDGIKMMFSMYPILGDFRRWSKLSIEEYAAKYKNPLLRKAMYDMFVPEMAIIFVIFTFAWMHNKSAGYPIGGSLKFAQNIEKTFLDLGGKIHYEKRVDKIITEGNKAKGIVLNDGDSYKADIVISAADGHSTIFEMLEGKYKDDKIEEYYSELPVFSSYLQVSFGVNRTFENEKGSIVFELDTPLSVDPGTETTSVGFRIFNFDPTVAPKGKTVISSMIGTRNYNYWCDLRNNDIHRYKEEKNRIANELLEILEKKYGRIKENLEMTDVSTPSTVIRYTNNWKGSFEGWILPPGKTTLQMNHTLPGLEDFYMAGQWVEPGGGVPSAILSGRNVAQIICHKDGVKFETKQF